MAKPLRVLIVEDSEDDALLVMRELERGGYTVISERVETAETMAAARTGRDWDLIIADYNLPHFSAPEALELIRRSGLDLPFIVVSGTVGEETAVETMRHGAHDYLLKDNLTRLVPVIQRELHEAAIRKERRQAQHDLGERVKELECLYGIAMITQKPDVTLEEVCQEAVNLVPPGWHYPDITCARVTVDGKEFVTPGFRETVWRQASDILVDDKRVGVVEVYYLEEMPELDEGPFLREERNLIDGIAGQLAGFVQRRRAEDLKEHLSAMLRAIRNVNQLIVKEKNPDRLLKHACENFVSTQDCDLAWIALLDSSGNITKAAEAGVDGVLPIIPRLKQGTLPNCGQKALRQSTVITTGASSARCRGCSLAESCTHPGVMTARLEYGGKVYGLLSAALPSRFLGEPQERSLFKEVAGDIGFALHGMELEGERKQAEERLRFLGSITEQVSESVVVTDADYRITYVNQAMLSLYGYSEDEIIGQTPVVLNAEPMADSIQGDVYATVHAGGTYQGAALNKRKDGSTFDCEFRVSPVYDENGQITGHVGIQRDVTERKKTEGDIRRASEEWQRTFDSITDAVSIHDTDFRIARVNRACADLLKMKPEDLVGRRCYEVFHGLDEPLANCPFKKTIEAKESARVEFFEPYLGIHLEGATSPIFNEKADVVACVHVARDISERKQAEEELSSLYQELKSLNIELEEKVKERTGQLEEAVQAAEVANRTKSDFLASMSHELRTPLSAVIGFSQVLQEQYFGNLNEKQSEYVADILDSGQHLLSLINDILDLSKIEAGKMELDLSNVKMRELIEGSLVMIKEKALAHGISLDTDYSEELEGLQLMADARKLKQVMFNLLSNAAKFTPDGGSIIVSCWKEGEMLNVSVEDTGIGLAPEDEEKIFGEFYQVHGSLASKTSGTGLGLSLSRSIVEMHNGRICVESQGVGKGSRFTFNLPIHSEGVSHDQQDSDRRG